MNYQRAPTYSAALPPKDEDEPEPALLSSYVSFNQKVEGSAASYLTPYRPPVQRASNRRLGKEGGGQRTSPQTLSDVLKPAFTAIDKLKVWYLAHQYYPYPTEQEKSDLAEDCGLQKKQINDWFVSLAPYPPVSPIYSHFFTSAQINARRRIPLESTVDPAPRSPPGKRSNPIPASRGTPPNKRPTTVTLPRGALANSYAARCTELHLTKEDKPVDFTEYYSRIQGASAAAKWQGRQSQLHSHTQTSPKKHSLSPITWDTKLPSKTLTFIAPPPVTTVPSSIPMPLSMSMSNKTFKRLPFPQTQSFPHYYPPQQTSSNTLQQQYTPPLSPSSSLNGSPFAHAGIGGKNGGTGQFYSAYNSAEEGTMYLAPNWGH